MGTRSSHPRLPRSSSRLSRSPRRLAVGVFALEVGRAAATPPIWVALDADAMMAAGCTGWREGRVCEAWGAEGLVVTLRSCGSMPLREWKGPRMMLGLVSGREQCDHDD